MHLLKLLTLLQSQCLQLVFLSLKLCYLTLLEFTLHVALQRLHLEFVTLTLQYSALDRPLVDNLCLEPSQLLLSLRGDCLCLKLLAINGCQLGPLLCTDKSKLMQLRPQLFIVA